MVNTRVTYLIPALLFCIAPLSFAQNKQETFNFILEKLSQGLEHQDSDQPLIKREMALDGCTLKVEEKYFSDSDTTPKMLLSLSYTVPLDKMDPTRVTNVMGAVTIFATGDEKTIRMIHKDMESGETKTIDQYQAVIQADTLYKAERAGRAFAHLIKLCGGKTEELFSKGP